MNSFFIYHLPGSDDFIGGAGSVENGLHAGFVISSFYNRPEATLSIISEESISINSLNEIANKIVKKDDTNLLFPFPEKSTDKKIYLKNVEDIICSLKENEKTVFSRVILGNELIDLSASLSSLLASFPSAFVFCFYTPQSGIWIGATPEKLLQNCNGRLSTVALAGTRSIDNSVKTEEWDKKNIEEQGMVIDYISTIFKNLNIPVLYDYKPKSKRVGHLEHLCTDFVSTLNNEMTKQDLIDFLYQLSPTPALCGLPKEKAYYTIKSTEDFNRAFYGGFAGPFFSGSDFSFYVILRSIRTSSTQWCMYAGGGITKDSVPEKEWEETKKKACSILDKMIFYNLKRESVIP